MQLGKRGFAINYNFVEDINIAIKFGKMQKQ